MSTRHRAARFEDWFTARLSTRLRGRGWRPRVVGYTGYGGVEPRADGADGADGASGAGEGGWVRVLGRVVLTRPLREGEPEHVEPLDGEPLGAAAVKALRGWRSFLASPVAGAPVSVTVAGRRHIATSDRGGYLDAVLPSALPAGTHTVTLEVEGAEPTEATVLVIGDAVERGVVSDIDDTVMVTSLPRPLIAAWNTLVLYPQARRPVPGMAELLTQAAARRPDTPVLYLSTGAWNIAPLLRRFVERHGFPSGPMLLTDWGPTNTGWFRSGQDHKRASLRRLQREFPRITWLLVGDDGQHDPVIYREFASDAARHVHAIAIRQLTPAEQVLSHGLPVPVPARSTGGLAPEVQGPDGLNLLRQLRGAGLL